MKNDDATSEYYGKLELLSLLKERLLPPFERRRRRWKAAWERFKTEGGSLADMVNRARTGCDLRADEYTLVSLGRHPSERKKR